MEQIIPAQQNGIRKGHNEKLGPKKWAADISKPV